MAHVCSGVASGCLVHLVYAEMNPNLFADFIGSVNWTPLVEGVVTGAIGLYLFLQLRYLVVTFIAFQRAQNGKAIVNDFVMLRDNHQWQAQKIGFRWIELRRYEGSTTKRKQFTKYIRTKVWADIEVTKVFTENGG